ncbi:MAG: energy-coupling factor transporter ATPase [Caloramator sp.]|nr:energy-coupling factor transporter ATPase [Caloramator sp.]
MEVINIQDVTYWYPDCNNRAIEDINLKINEGELVLITGPSGCGKSTLIRLINRVIPDYYGGKIKGNVYLNGRDIVSLKMDEIIKNVGMVYQHPEKQIILQDVEREIAFGLENLGFDVNKMKRNVCEVISLLALNFVKNRQTTELSGGEKQRVAIASVVSMNPEIILFDEPISQLDPIGAEEVINSIKKLNRDFGKTILLVEQRLDKCFDIADRIIFMEKGKIIAEGTPNKIPKEIKSRYHLPNITYIFNQAGENFLPVNVKQAREAIKDRTFSKPDIVKKSFNESILEVEKLSFEYEKGLRTLRNINFQLHKGEILCVMGENGAGKSTLFKIIAGLIKDYTGNILISGKNIKKFDIFETIKKIGYLSQNPNDYFGRKTVFEEVSYTLKNIDEFNEKRVKDVLRLFDIDHLKEKNPRDLSGGEKQRVALACTLVADPQILILDEPTRGMDAVAKENLGEIIKKLASQGKSIVLITHDVDFAADYVDTVLIMFGGEVVARGYKDDILCDAIYYSPQISKVFKNKCKVTDSKNAINLILKSKYKDAGEQNEA